MTTTLTPKRRSYANIYAHLRVTGTGDSITFPVPAHKASITAVKHGDNAYTLSTVPAQSTQETYTHDEAVEYIYHYLRGKAQGKTA